MVKAKQRTYRYAEGTDVPVAKSKEEIERALRNGKAGQIVHGSDPESETGFIAFTLDRRQIRIDVSFAEKRGVQQAATVEQREKEAWRVLLLMLKAKLEVIRMGITSVEKEFLANIVLTDGSVVSDHVSPALEKIYSGGRMLPLLPSFKRLPAPSGAVDGELDE